VLAKSGKTEEALAEFNRAIELDPNNAPGPVRPGPVVPRRKSASAGDSTISPRHHGASNAFGLVGFEANLPGPGKRPLSSMSPTIVLKNGKPVLVTGSPGGSRIISTVLQVIVNVLDYHMDVAAAVDAPRLHHQWLPDEVPIERGFAADTLAGLRARGHQLVEPMGQTSANSIAVTPNGLLGRPRSAYPWRGRGGTMKN